MSKLAFIFPGQGSQSVGMGQDLAASHESIQGLYQSLDEALGFSISNLCFEGPAEELTLTFNAQPAIVGTSFALFQAFSQNCDLKPDFVAGHSVGEYSALGASGVLNVEKLVELVHYRGKYMDEACPAGTGGMAALVGMDEEKAMKLLSGLELDSGEILDLAGLNCPGQVVVAGHLSAIDKAISKVRDFGGRVGMKLNVSGPFHSRLMGPAQEQLKDKLSALEFNTPDCPVVTNVTAKAESDPEKLKSALMSQLTQPVKWEASVREMIDAGVDRFVEFGAGNVLAGMIKKIDRTLRVLPVHDSESLNKAIQELL